MSGRLWLVATPIGNLEDISLRALRVLREAERVLAEDTRRSRTLLAHHNIETPLASLHAHSSRDRVEGLADELAEGKHFALVTDAGTPLVSDPGAALVQAAIARGVAVEAVPGASAVITALCVSGLRTDQFRFVGFLPRSGRRRRESLGEIARDRLASVMFEAPNRLLDTLRELSQVCGETRRAAVCRELTKLHEETARGSLAELVAHFTEQEPRGEITLVIEGHGVSAEESDAAELDPELEAAEALDIEASIRERLARGLGAKEIARELATLHGLDKRELYARVVALRGQK
ncbi:MAG: 16S rRNA (cytidine(1402)-2'-O)-methyltransferase [Myxococcales bacterium]